MYKNSKFFIVNRVDFLSICHLCSEMKSVDLTLLTMSGSGEHLVWPSRADGRGGVTTCKHLEFFPSRVDGRGAHHSRSIRVLPSRVDGRGVTTCEHLEFFPSRVDGRGAHQLCSFRVWPYRVDERNL